jgi:hypothetical protein
MALKKATLQLIATLTKTKLADLETAINDEKEVDLTIEDNLQVFTKEELESRDGAQKAEGQKVGREIGIKEVKKAAGLPEDAPAKDPAKVAQAIIEKATVDAKVEPSEKVKQLNEQVSLLQKQVGEKDAEIETHKKTAATITLDNKIRNSFPKNRIDMLDDDDMLASIKRNHTFEEQDGKLIVKKDGELLRDSKTTNAMPLADAVKTIFTERKWLTEEGGAGGGTGGRGGGDKSGAIKYKKASEVKEKYEKEGKNINGQDGQAYLAEIAALKKEDESFDMNN